jgi:hypothetical protein
LDAQAGSSNSDKPRSEFVDRSSKQYSHGTADEMNFGESNHGADSSFEQGQFRAGGDWSRSVYAAESGDAVIDTEKQKSRDKQLNTNGSILMILKDAFGTRFKSRFGGVGGVVDGAIETISYIFGLYRFQSETKISKHSFCDD